MPRYCYMCDSCGVSTILFHLMDETIDECLACRSQHTMIKQLTTPLYKKKIEPQSQKVGSLTEEFIDINRDILNQEKEKREDYDPT